jgi:hypothetical protein
MPGLARTLVKITAASLRDRIRIARCLKAFAVDSNQKADESGSCNKDQSSRNDAVGANNTEASNDHEPLDQRWNENDES